MQTAKVPEISVEDYLAGELVSHIKHEYVDGAVYAMAGGTREHAEIAGNIFALLHTHLRGKPSRVFNSDLKVYVASVNCYYYPDLAVSCDARDLGPPSGRQFIEYPCLIVEVLSKTTENIDRREKLAAYRTSATLQEYVLVDQYRLRVEVYRRADQGWLHEILGLGDELDLRSVDVRASLDTIYANVDLPQVAVP